jgi:hypothetical protein
MLQLMQRDIPKEFFVLLKIESPDYHQFITQGSRYVKEDKKIEI